MTIKDLVKDRRDILSLKYGTSIYIYTAPGKGKLQVYAIYESAQTSTGTTSYMEVTVNGAAIFEERHSDFGNDIQECNYTFDVEQGQQLTIGTRRTNGNSRETKFMHFIEFVPAP